MDDKVEFQYKQKSKRFQPENQHKVQTKFELFKEKE